MKSVVSEDCFEDDLLETESMPGTKMGDSLKKQPSPKDWRTVVGGWLGLGRLVLLVLIASPILYAATVLIGFGLKK